VGMVLLRGTRGRPTLPESSTGSTRRLVALFPTASALQVAEEGLVVVGAHWTARRPWHPPGRPGGTAR
jgi:hypothetical protein